MIDHFGTFCDSTRGDSPIKKITLSNSQCLVEIITLGGAIKRLQFHREKAQSIETVLGYDRLEGYLNQNHYLGAVVGRLSNRVGWGKVDIKGHGYMMPRNENEHTLHGGDNSISKFPWQILALEEGSEPSVKLGLVSCDGAQGLPGEVALTLCYRLLADNTLEIVLTAVPDKDTALAFTVHPYFNLNSDPQHGIGNHRLRINADKYTPVDSALLPLGDVVPVAGTAFDFRTERELGDCLTMFREALAVTKGYDHNWALNTSTDDLRLAATLYCPETRVTLETRTNQPGLQFYSGNHLKPSADAAFYPYAGLCLECQNYPDAVNQPGFPSCIVNAGETYVFKTTYRLVEGEVDLPVN